MKKNKTNLKLSLIAGSILLASSAFGVELVQQGNNISFESLENTQYNLTVRTPSGEVQTFKINNGESSLSADMLGLKSLSNGQYKYELTPITKSSNLSLDVRNLNDDAISAEYAKTFKPQALTLSGAFSLNKGELIKNTDENQTKDQIILDDLIVDGSACIGFDCVNGESFGFDTLRLKENNLRIKFQDTSSSSSFPSNDWQITVNDSSNGGLNKFSIDDIDGGRTPFTIEAGAPSHSLYVDDGGRLGLGTSTPVVDAHIKTGNTPTLRLEQDGSSGFTPQTWDVAGNEANFFIRDATNGSTLPFRIRPGAPSSAIDVAAGGNIGMGTDSPAANLHIKDTTGTGAAMLTLENTGGSFITMTKNAKSWFLTYENNSESFGMSHTDTGGGQALTLTEAGNMTIKGTLTTTGTVCSTGAAPSGCDFVFSDDYKLASIEDHAAEMYENSYLPNVGPTIENAPFNLTEKTGGMLNELEKAHIYIAQLNSRLNEKTSELSEIKKRLIKLESK
ncbi:MAG: hypothetical protein JKY19_02215 [Alcanivoracaceae bacterium]|nr:hypothetical protein [Alcanivoracaceae bacterium]